MLPIIQSLWIGKPLSKLEQLCIQSFLDHGHEFHLYTYAKVGNIPPGTIVKDGNAILPSESIFHDDHGSVAGFSDWFRYALLVKCGGFWVDMDTVCIKPFAFAEQFVFGMQKVNLAATGVIGGQHEVLIALRDACESFPKIMPWDSNKTRLRKLRRRLLSVVRKGGREGVRYGSVGGPLPFTDILRYFKSLELGQAPLVFYPILSPDWHSAFDSTYALSGDEFVENSTTYAMTWWNSRTKERPGFDKNATFPENSLIEQLKRKHKII